MNTIIIKQARYRGGDTKVFRAYSDAPDNRHDEPLGVTLSTTGNRDCGVMRCAVKAFIRFAEPKADPDEIETRISIETISETLSIWRANLQPKEGK